MSCSLHILHIKACINAIKAPDYKKAAVIGLISGVTPLVCRRVDNETDLYNLTGYRYEYLLGCKRIGRS